MTLKETYTVTAIPETLLDLITHIVKDAQALADEKYGLFDSC